MSDLIERIGGLPQVRKVRKGGFSAQRRQMFLDALALTCNVERAAAFAEIDKTTVYRTRLRDAAFSAQWREALAMGYDRLEALALEHGGAGQPIDVDPDRAAAGADAIPFDFEKAMLLLKYHRAERYGEMASGRQQTTRPALRLATPEETNATLMKALDAAERRVVRARQNDG